MTRTDRVELERMIAVLGQGVASVLADLRLEILAIRQLLDERRTVSQDSLNQRVAVLRDEELPSLTAATSAELLHRFSRLCEQVGLRPKQPPPN